MSIDYKPVLSTPLRSDRWREVWDHRDEERADWNGCEACFESLEAYEQWGADVAAMIRDELDLSPDDVVADLGCGTGRIAALVAPHVRQVLAFDYSDLLLKIASSRRGTDNIVFRTADLNVLNSAELPVTKAFAVGSLFYLNSMEGVVRFIRGFVDRGVAFAAVDLPDASIPDGRERSYDTEVYSHLRFDLEYLLRQFPNGRVIRGRFPGYVNDSSRFSFFIGGKGLD